MPDHHLPTKPCAQCKREFAWRKKWERDWERVKYCSKKCAAAGRGDRRGSEPPLGSGPADEARTSAGDR